MKSYMNFDTGEVFTEDEIREAYNMFGDTDSYESFEEFMDVMLDLGRSRIGGFIDMDDLEGGAV